MNYHKIKNMTGIPFGGWDAFFLLNRHVTMMPTNISRTATETPIATGTIIFVLFPVVALHRSTVLHRTGLLLILKFDQ